MSANDEILEKINKRFQKMYPDNNTRFTEYCKTTKNGCEYIVASSNNIKHLSQNNCYTVLGKEDKLVSSSIFILSPQSQENNETLIQITGRPENKYDVGIRRSNNPAGCSIRMFNKGVPYGSLKVDYYTDVSDLSNIGQILNNFINKTQTLNVSDKKALRAAQDRYSLYAQRIKNALLIVTDTATLDKQPVKIRKNPNPLLGFPHSLPSTKNRL